MPTDAFQERRHNPLGAGKSLLKNPPFNLLICLDIYCYICYYTTMTDEARRPCNIRIRPSILHQGRVAAVTKKKSLGQWLEEAILEKIEKEQNLRKEGQR